MMVSVKDLGVRSRSRRRCVLALVLDIVPEGPIHRRLQGYAECSKIGRAVGRRVCGVLSVLGLLIPLHRWMDADFLCAVRTSAPGSDLHALMPYR